MSGSRADSGGVAPMMLAVESDPKVARALARDLERGFAPAFRAEGNCDPAAALELLRRRRRASEPVALLVAGQKLPGTTGIELLTEARRIQPDLRGLLLISHSDRDRATAAIHGGVADHYLIRPWDAELDLLPAAGELLESWEVERDRGEEAPVVVGERDSWNANRIRNFLERNLVRYRWVDADCAEGERLLAGLDPGDASRQPVMFLPDGRAAVQPTNVAIADRLGIATRPKRERYELVVVGAGPSGLAAGVYGASEGLSTVVIEQEAPGGQAGQSSMIENYLGFPRGLTGADLARRALMQAQKFKAEIVRPRTAARFELDGDDRLVELSDHTLLRTRSLVIATGVEYRRLRAPGCAELLGAGVYYGADPRGAAERAGQDVFVVGGANSAGQAAVMFARRARSVTMLVRGESLELGMSRYLIDKIEALENVEVLTGTEVAEVHGSNRLEEITLLHEGETRRVPGAALYVFIGALPRTDWLGDAVARDERGFILSGRELVADEAVDGGWPLERDPYALETSVPGVFVVGDVRHGSIKRVASAVGEGAMAVQLTHQYLRELS